jgi:hypothetical protein
MLTPSLLLILSALSQPAIAQMQHTTNDQGVVHFSDGDALGKLAINGHTPEWTPFRQQDAAIRQPQPETFSGAIPLPAPGKGELRFGEQITSAELGVRIDYELTFAEDTPLTGAYVSAFLDTSRFAAARARLLPSGVQRELPREQGDPQLDGTVAGFAVDCGGGSEFAVIGSAIGSLHVQDNRQFGSLEYEFRFALVSGNAFAGQTAARSFRVLKAAPDVIDAIVKEMHPPMTIDRTKPFILFRSAGDAAVMLGQTQLMSIQAAVHGLGWAYRAQSDGQFSASGDSRSRTFTGEMAIPPDDGSSIRVHEQVSIAEPDGVDLFYQFRFPEGGRLNGYQVSFSIPVSRYVEKTIRLQAEENREVVIPAELGENFLHSGPVTSVAVAPGEPEGFRIEPDQPTPLLIQDNRGWQGDTIELRFNFVREDQGSEVPAGYSVERRFALRWNQPLQAVLDEAAGTDQTDTSGWVAYTLPWDSCPVDVSFLNDHEAGSEGFVTVRDGKFVFSDSGRSVRFWGTNFSAGANFPTHEQSERIAERLKRFGVNIVRTHHADTDWGERSLIDKNRDDSRHFDEESLDRFDYLIYCLKKAGIYIYLDQLVNRKFRPGDGIEGYEEIADNRSAKPYSNFDERLIELQKEYSRNLWTHVNPYTNLAYKDDPAIALMEFANENDLFTQQVTAEPFRTNLEKRYRAWAQERNIELPAGRIDFTQKTDAMMHFLIEVQTSFYAEMAGFLRDEVGVKIPMTGSNWSRNAALLMSLRDLPYTDSHTYWDHPQGNGAFNNRSQTTARGNTIGGLAFNSMVGKPFFVSEWDQPWPNEWRAEYPLLIAAAAAFQDWNGLTVYTYRHSSSVPIDHLSGAFETFNDPARFGLFPTAALLFRRGDVDVAREMATFVIPEALAAGADSPGAWGMRGLGDGLCELHKVRIALGEGAGNGGHVLGPSDRVFPEEATEVRSDTGQLYRSWEERYGTINTPRAKAVYGYPGGKGDIKLGDVTLKVETDFATVALASLTDSPIAESNTLLLTAVGRAENTGFKYNVLRRRAIDRGAGPILAEPIAATIRMKTSLPGLTVRPILPDGTRGAELPARYEDGLLSFAIGPQGKTIYYEIARG